MTREQLLDVVREGLSHYPEYDGPGNERFELDEAELERSIRDYLREWLEMFDEDFAATIQRDPLPDDVEEEEWTLESLCDWLFHTAQFMLFLASRVPDWAQRGAAEIQNRPHTIIEVGWDPHAPEGLTEV